ncbi:RbsD/FucU family protein [Nakamurella lactea]|uniref:RbsD/FucU family protein n=1 Tax=Nakamurella lactea TaxID=459515 RepID=UPI0004271219|nr:RbsD/FucU domain-containing protein [Nakamurella lactea]
MLNGIPSLLTGELLATLDAMGHSDAVVVADAHFPGAALADRLIDLPGVSTPQLVRAICAVLPLDDAPTLDLMQSADGVRLPVQDELLAAAGLAGETAVHTADEPAAVRELDRFAFYEQAATAFAIVRTGELRPYGNAILRKGLAQPDERWRG